jgi:hypothetical protein
LTGEKAKSGSQREPDKRARGIAFAYQLNSAFERFRDENNAGDNPEVRATARPLNPPPYVAP